MQTTGEKAACMGDTTHDGQSPVMVLQTVWSDFVAMQLLRAELQVGRMPSSAKANSPCR